MFQFNSNTVVNKEFKVREIVKLINGDSLIKKEVSNIEKITLKNIISKDTLNIKSDDKCKEIYVFFIVLKQREVPINFIKAFDKFIQLHTYFVFQYKYYFKELCIYRTIEDSVIKREKLYEKDWEEENLIEMPYCIDVLEVYKRLVMSFIDLKPRNEEDLDNFIKRYDEIQKLKKDISILEKKAFKEIQPRKKFEYGREIRKIKEKLTLLER